MEEKKGFTSQFCDMLAEHIIGSRPVREQDMHTYRGVCINILDGDPQAQEQAMSDLEEMYYRLQTYAGEYIDSDEKKKAFSLGRAMSVYETLKQHIEAREQTEKKAEIAERYCSIQGARKILDSIAVHESGVAHGLLAKECGMSDEELTETVRTLRNDGTFYMIRRGRGRHYIITPLGKDVLMLMDRIEQLKVVIEIPEDFVPHWEHDRFEDSLARMSADVHRFAGVNERLLAEMLISAFKQAECERIKNGEGMKITFCIPGSFAARWYKDRFKISMIRMYRDIYQLAGNYEKELASMLINAFESAGTGEHE